MRGIFWSVLLGALIAIWEISLVPILGHGRSAGLVVPSMVLLLMVSRPARLFIMVFTSGLILDSYSLLRPELHSLRFLLLGLLAWLIFQRWLTNRSLYSALALAALLTLLERLSLFVIELVSGSSLGLGSWGSGLLAAWAWSAAVTSSGFILIASLTRRLSVLFPDSRGSSWYD